MKYLLTFLASALLFTSCEDFFSQTIEIDPPAYDKNLSFHLSLGTQDSSIQVTMTRNYGILEDVDHFQDWFVNGVRADIYENGQKWLTLNPLNIDTSFILTGSLPHHFKAGNTYELRAEHPDFPTLSATQQVPSDFQVDSVRVRHNAVLGESGEVLDLLEVYITDQPGLKNFYEVTLLNRVFEMQYDPFTGAVDTIGPRLHTLNVDGYNDPNVQYGYDDTGLFSDQFFNGQQYKFQARFYGSSSDYIDSLTTVRVRNVTEDYYQWSLSYQRKYDSDDNPLVEPISVFNNLKNGLGIFSIANEKRYYITKKP